MRNFPLALNDGAIEVVKSGNYLIVRAMKCGITVKFDGRSVVTVSIPRSFEGKTTGLCGNCGRPELDFTTSDGKKVAANKEGFMAIGDSYNVPILAGDDEKTYDVFCFINSQFKFFVVILLFDVLSTITYKYKISEMLAFLSFLISPFLE